MTPSVTNCCQRSTSTVSLDPLMLRGDLKSSGSDWIVYSSAGFFRFLLGNIASFMPAWLFLWHKSEMTNGTQQLPAAKWHWVSKGLIKHFISYFLNYICVCIYIRNVTCHVFFSVCCFSLTSFFFTPMNSKILLKLHYIFTESHISNWFTVQCLEMMMKLTATALIREFRN